MSNLNKVMAIFNRIPKLNKLASIMCLISGWMNILVHDYKVAAIMYALAILNYLTEKM